MGSGVRVWGRGRTRDVEVGGVDIEAGGDRRVLLVVNLPVLWDWD